MKTFYFLILIIFSCLTMSNGQGYQKLYGSESDQIFNDLILTKDGSYIIVGTKINQNNDSSIVVLKIKQNGDTVWAKNYSFEKGINPTRIIEQDNGNFILSGFELKNDLNNGHSRVDMFLTSEGNIISIRNHPDQRRGEHVETIYTSDNSYLVVNNVEFASTVKAVYISKRKFNFDKQYVRIYRRSNSDICKQVFELPDGSYFILGETYSLGIRKDILILKFTQNGSFDWAKSLGKDQNESLSSAWQNSDGTIVIVGSSNSYSSNILREEMLISKIDTAGNIEWAKTYGALGSITGKSIFKTGAHYQILGDQNELNGNESNMIYLKIDEVGNLIESSSYAIEVESNMKILKSFNDETLIGCTKNIENKSQICLIKSSDLNSCNASIQLTSQDIEMNQIIDPSKEGLSTGDVDVILTASLNSHNGTIDNTCLSANSYTTNPTNIRVFPNPAKDIVQIKGLNENSLLSLLDVTGKTIRTLIALENSSISLDNIPSGIYFLKVFEKAHITTIKLIKF